MQDRVSLYPGRVKLTPVAGQANLYDLTRADQPTQQELVDRLMFIQANEAARCFEENVVRSVADANIGSIFGWGFAPHQGGALQFINAMGVQRFVARSRELARQHGARFEPAAILVQMAQENARFQDA